MSRPVAVVTGGAAGIGLAFARSFAKAGYAVMIADIDEAAGQAAATGIVKSGGIAHAYATDVSAEASCLAMSAATLSHFGQIDVLVNNAALKTNGLKPFWEIPIPEWDRLMAVNARGAWLAMRACSSSMRDRGSGSIINIGSSAILVGGANFLHYAASKGALIAMTRSAARELGPFNVRVNCILAGRINTASSNTSVPATAAHGRAIEREETPDDLTGAALFLASTSAAYLTGQCLNVDGGRSFV